MVARVLIAIANGFIVSAFLREPTHASDFPELGRYAIGGVLIGANFYIFERDTESQANYWLAAVCAAVGVLLARLHERVG